ncbi:uncharacterized protein N7496_005633 [Penicillium cataractarum]|uniref:Major facilitator superfamily (MFS) profile domain-containing protein n=1 Tax=Penicillium cataractarum TaxID=2100454 RepID=A0A9W9SI98_9EURO|nr:uncharacterized protein N7496_005633 [Penicillium cataractarum]KAJ5378224.1 hypothetical protein N7496_005633 [Penicillium cataractarum]
MDVTRPDIECAGEVCRASPEEHRAHEEMSDHSHISDESPQTAPDILSEKPAENDREAEEEEEADGAAEAPYSVLPSGEKAFVIIMGSFAALISPLSSSAYLPALNTLARDMHVSVSLINLTITTYLIFQGLSPSFVGSFSDGHGRRPAYIVSFIIYLGANIGLALQNSYSALMVLRCLQSAGSSGTIALGSAVVADLTTRAERGKYIGYASMGISLGPALGPIVGGLLDHFLGWRSIFWFLVILSGVLFIVILMVLPETCRAVVGNGSIVPPSWNRPLWTLCTPKSRFRRDEKSPDLTTIQKPKRRPNPISSLLILAQKEAGMILLYGGLLFSGYQAVLSTLSTQLSSRFGFNSIQIGLCYLPIGLGSISSRWTVGTLLDWNFRREARLQGMVIHKNRQQDIANFNIERARLAVALPMIYLGALSILAYGWVMQYRTSLAGPIIMLYFMGLTTSGSFNTLNTLVVDVNHQSAATAVAASNLCRCLMGAGTTAFVGPLIEAIGIGWTGTIVAVLWALFSPLLWLVFLRGHSWRQMKARREQQKLESSVQDPQGKPDVERGSGGGQS